MTNKNDCKSDMATGAIHPFCSPLSPSAIVIDAPPVFNGVSEKNK